MSVKFYILHLPINYALVLYKKKDMCGQHFLQRYKSILFSFKISLISWWNKRRVPNSCLLCLASRYFFLSEAQSDGCFFPWAQLEIVRHNLAFQRRSMIFQHPTPFHPLSSPLLIVTSYSLSSRAPLPVRLFLKCILNFKLLLSSTPLLCSSGSLLI